MTSITCDWKANKNNVKGKIVTLAFRIANVAKKNRIFFFIFLPYLILYRLLIEWILGIEIPWKTQIGKGFTLYHGHSLVINDGTVIGNNCTIRHCVTIGNKKLTDGTYSECPRIGNNVDIGSNVVIIGPLIIGDNVTIGAGSVVVKNVPSGTIVVGNPAKVLRYIEEK